MLTSETPQEYAGGIARYVDNFARIASAAGHDLTVIARTNEEIDLQVAKNFRLLGFEPRYRNLEQPTPAEATDRHPAYPYNILGFWPGLSYEMAETVLGLLKRQPAPDVIESQEYGALPYYLLQRKLTERGPLEQIPIVTHLHSASYDLMRINQAPRYRFPDYWIGQMEKFSIQAADAVLSPSMFLARHTQEQFEQPLQITSIPYPMHLPDLTEEAVAVAGELVYVGRLELRKGVLEMVQACARLWEAGHQFRLTLIGGDTDFKPRGTTVGTFLRTRYARWIDSGLLSLPGRMAQAEVLSRMRNAWAIIVPSLWENFPNTCIEAMGVGQVVLASTSGGQAEMIAESGVNGFLFDWEKAGDFERNVTQILDLSREEHTAIAARARRRIEEFCNPLQVLQARLSHFEHIIAQHAPRRAFPGPQFGAATPHPATPSVAPVPAEPGTNSLLSVVIPFYNLGELVEETLDSALASTYRPLEVVIVDDGSTNPASIAKLQQIEARKQPEIRIVRTQNGGLASARNIGAEAAHGTYITFLDADDTVAPDYFERAVDVLQRYDNVAFVYSWVRWFESTNHIWPTWNAEFPYLLGHNMLAAFVVMPRERFLAVGRNNPAVAYSLEDFEAWISVVEAGGVGVSLPHPLVHYRIRAGSMYRSSQHDQKLYLYDIISHLHPELYKRWGVELFNLQNANGPALLWNHPALEISGEPPNTLHELRQSHLSLWQESQTLAKAWQDQKDYIDAQRQYIEQLESQCESLLGLVNAAHGPRLPADGTISINDYLLGGRMVHRVRQHGLTPMLLRIPLLKRALRRVLVR
ncbi:MAG TPA: glycosyltransferase [Roseiflexaceae bacterium]|nr:glycosyltransferase [Roseiflexaceae bacterium]